MNNSKQSSQSLQDGASSVSDNSENSGTGSQASVVTSNSSSVSSDPAGTKAAVCKGSRSSNSGSESSNGTDCEKGCCGKDDEQLFKPPPDSGHDLGEWSSVSSVENVAQVTPEPKQFEVDSQTTETRTMDETKPSPAESSGPLTIKTPSEPEAVVAASADLPHAQSPPEAVGSSHDPSPEVDSPTEVDPSPTEVDPSPDNVGQSQDPNAVMGCPTEVDAGQYYHWHEPLGQTMEAEDSSTVDSSSQSSDGLEMTDDLFYHFQLLSEGVNDAVELGIGLDNSIDSFQEPEMGSESGSSGQYENSFRPVQGNDQDDIYQSTGNPYVCMNAKAQGGGHFESNEEQFQPSEPDPLDAHEQPSPWQQFSNNGSNHQSGYGKFSGHEDPFVNHAGINMADNEQVGPFTHDEHAEASIARVKNGVGQPHQPVVLQPRNASKRLALDTHAQVPPVDAHAPDSGQDSPPLKASRRATSPMDDDSFDFVPRPARQAKSKRGRKANGRSSRSRKSKKPSKRSTSGRASKAKKRSRKSTRRSKKSKRK
ncbi:hypothetical protein HDE_01397 [Halotydeus destructor]|nr:hypothetical protein HDE_01397 [Halotydeus destructor]